MQSPCRCWSCLPSGARASSRRQRRGRTHTRDAAANDGWELVDAVEVHTGAHRIVDVIDELGRGLAARKRALIEQHQHVVALAKLAAA